MSLMYRWHTADSLPSEFAEPIWIVTHDRRAALQKTSSQSLFDDALELIRQPATHADGRVLHVTAPEPDYVDRKDVFRWRLARPGEIVLPSPAADAGPGRSARNKIDAVPNSPARAAGIWRPADKEPMPLDTEFEVCFIDPFVASVNAFPARRRAAGGALRLEFLEPEFLEPEFLEPPAAGRRAEWKEITDVKPLWWRHVSDAAATAAEKDDREGMRQMSWPACEEYFKLQGYVERNEVPPLPPAAQNRPGQTWAWQGYSKGWKNITDRCAETAKQIAAAANDTRREAFEGEPGKLYRWTQAGWKLVETDSDEFLAAKLARDAWNVPKYVADAHLDLKERFESADAAACEFYRRLAAIHPALALHPERGMAADEVRGVAVSPGGFLHGSPGGRDKTPAEVDREAAAVNESVNQCLGEIDRLTDGEIVHLLAKKVEHYRGKVAEVEAALEREKGYHQDDVNELKRVKRELHALKLHHAPK